MIIIQIICAASVGLACVVCLYHAVLAIVGIVTYGRKPKRADNASHSFAIVIPAHNEETTIEHTLRSCAKLDYPEGKYVVYVVADNCSDRTAQVAAGHGATCLERQDQERLGKGFALEWAFPRVLADGHDAIVVLDADCQIEEHGLRTFDQRLNAGDQVLQANDVVANPDDSPISYVLAVANLIANDLFHAPKSVLGMPVLLVGCGMVLHRDILSRFPWKARSLCEDTEYSLLLQRHGIPARFVPDVRVASDFPVNNDQFVVQRRRWISGGLQAGWQHGLKLISKGLMTCRPGLIDAGFTSVILSRPLVLGQLLLSGVLTLFCHLVASGLLSRILLISTLGVSAAYVLYAATGVYLLGLSSRRIGLLLRSPGVVLRYLLLALTTMLGAQPSTWNRTPRIQQVHEA